MTSFVGREKELFDYMRERNIPVYHHSNLFTRDVQTAIRDYIRERENRDIMTLEVDRLAAEFLDDLERRRVIVPFRPNSYTLELEEYRLEPAKKEETPAQTSQESVPA
jgi:hypothetical protein